MRYPRLFDYNGWVTGVDLNAAGELGIKTIWALSLPGKCAPLAAGEIILETIENCLLERGAI